MDNSNILIVEDETDIRELIHFHLFKNKFKAFEACDGEEAIKIAKIKKPELILLDIMLPKVDGLEVCRRLKSDPKTKDIKILFLSAKGEEEDIVKGLELGADDYVSKPFSPKVLIARVKAVLRRRVDSKKKEASLFGIRLDEGRKQAYSDEKEILLTVTEYGILKFLISSPGHVYTRGQIVNEVKGDNHAVTDRSVDTQLVSLRKKLGDKGKLIETVWGIGYRFKESEI